MLVVSIFLSWPIAGIVQAVSSMPWRNRAIICYSLGASSLGLLFSLHRQPNFYPIFTPLFANFPPHFLQAAPCQNNTVLDILRADPDTYLETRWVENIGGEIFLGDPIINTTIFAPTNDAVRKAAAEFGKIYSHTT